MADGCFNRVELGHLTTRQIIFRLLLGCLFAHGLAF